MAKAITLQPTSVKLNQSLMTSPKSHRRQHWQASLLSRVLEVPLVIGGGIRDGENAYQILRAGADVIVVGNAIEEDPSLIRSLSHAVQEAVSLTAKK
jgi:heptaprenylglyceryl phosphate synthase